MTARKVAALTRKTQARFGERDEQPTQSRADRAGQVLVDGAKRDPLRPLLLRHKFGLECLPGRGCPSLPDADQEKRGE